MRKNNWLAAAAICGMLAISCGSGAGNSGDPAPAGNEGAAAPAAATDPAPAASPKGVGPIGEVKLNSPLDQKMVAAGKSIYEVKCASCHKTTGEKLVGPGWKGVTDRRQPEWIMNFVVNTEEMLNKDAEAQKMLEVCMVRMPNQGLTETDARSVLEFMLSNDGKK